jgi:hypothetical protein
LSLADWKLLHELKPAEHVTGCVSIQVGMVGLHLGEEGSVGVCYKVEAVAARRCIAEDGVALVVLKDEMRI